MGGEFTTYDCFYRNEFFFIYKRLLRGKIRFVMSRVAFFFPSKSEDDEGLEENAGRREEKGELSLFVILMNKLPL